MRAKIEVRPGATQRTQRTPVIESTKKPDEAGCSGALNQQSQPTKAHNFVTPENRLRQPGAMYQDAREALLQIDSQFSLGHFAKVPQKDKKPSPTVNDIRRPGGKRAESSALDLA